MQPGYLPPSDELWCTKSEARIAALLPILAGARREEGETRSGL
jgi:hypothetical protein